MRVNDDCDMCCDMEEYMWGVGENGSVVLDT